jgi:hypothetical protein
VKRVLIVIAAVLVSACSQGSAEKPLEAASIEKIKAQDGGEMLTRVSDISQILMHEPGHYTFLVDQPGRKISQLEIRTGEPITILRDLDNATVINITYRCMYKKACLPIPENFSRWSLVATDLTIHLHSAEEINGAGWSQMEGKVRREGQTQVVR